MICYGMGYTCEEIREIMEKRGEACLHGYAKGLLGEKIPAETRLGFHYSVCSPCQEWWNNYKKDRNVKRDSTPSFIKSFSKG